MAAVAAVAVRPQYLWIHLDFESNLDGRVRALARALAFRSQFHFHNSVFQPGSSWITSNATHPYTNARYISTRARVSRKMREYTVRLLRSYVAALTGRGDALFGN